MSAIVLTFPEPLSNEKVLKNEGGSGDRQDEEYVLYDKARHCHILPAKIPCMPVFSDSGLMV
jgi:hypothetical protein